MSQFASLTEPLMYFCSQQCVTEALTASVEPSGGYDLAHRLRDSCWGPRGASAACVCIHSAPCKCAFERARVCVSPCPKAERTMARGRAVTRGEAATARRPPPSTRDEQPAQRWPGLPCMPTCLLSPSSFIFRPSDLYRKGFRRPGHRGLYKAAFFSRPLLANKPFSWRIQPVVTFLFPSCWLSAQLVSWHVFPRLLTKRHSNAQCTALAFIIPSETTANIVIINDISLMKRLLRCRCESLLLLECHRVATSNDSRF